jgi:phosphoribosyl-ATP pyrophosphohydrolase
MPLDAQKFSVPSVRFDTPILPQENVYVPPRGAEMETQTIQPDQMKIKQYIKSLTATQINAILDKMPEEQSTVLFAKLADKKKIKDKRSILQQQAESDLGFADLLMEEMQAVPPRPAASAYPAPQTQADFERLQREEQLNADWEAFLAAEELGAEFNEPPPEEEEGSGRRRSKKHGKGTPEGILGGLPGGMRNALALRPIDRRPLNLDNPMPDNEEDLSLPRRMQFLTTTEHYRLYDDDEPQINSQSQYKKMKKRLAKLRD